MVDDSDSNFVQFLWLDTSDGSLYRGFSMNVELDFDVDPDGTDEELPGHVQWSLAPGSDSIFIVYLTDVDALTSPTVVQVDVSGLPGTE